MKALLPVSRKRHQEATNRLDALLFIHKKRMDSYEITLGLIIFMIVLIFLVLYRQGLWRLR